MNISKETQQLVEQVIALAWPAEIEEPYHSWMLRANRGVSKRANSVFTIGEMPSTDNWLSEIERFYDNRLLSPCFYIGENTPQEVDQLLAKNNYEIINEMYLLYHESKRVVETVEKNNELVTTFNHDVNSSWVDSFMQLERHDTSLREGYEIIFQNIQIPKMFLTLKLNEKVVALGTVAIKDGWGYISNVVVDQRYRRRGFGSQVIRELAKWAYEHDTKYIFLQVKKTNKAGLKLYEHLGFSTLSESHFRIKTVNY